MAFQLDGTAALAAAPFRVIRSNPAPTLHLESGADASASLGDLVDRLEEVVRWLRAREMERHAEPVLRFGEVEVVPGTQTIRRGGKPVAVTRTEFRVLYALMQRAGRAVGREELRDAVWGPDRQLRSRAIDTHIARLRRKLEADPAHPRHILTAPHHGYRLDPPGGSTPPSSHPFKEALCDLDVVGL